MQEPNLSRADFVTGLTLVALGAGATVESWRMPRLEEMNINPYTAPGLVPGILGAVLTVLGCVLLVRAARAGGWRLFGAGRAGARLDGADMGRVGMTLVLTIGYAGGLVGQVPFWLATFLFVFAFVVLFEWEGGRTAWQTARALTLALVMAACTSGAVTAVFQYVFLVQLP